MAPSDRQGRDRARAAEQQTYPGSRFDALSESARKLIDAYKITVAYPEGSQLFMEGESARTVFIITEGKVKLTTSSTEGRTLILGLSGPGEALGLSAIILDQPYDISAETIAPSKIEHLKKQDFIKMLNENHEISICAAAQLSEQYYDAQKEIRSLGLSHTTTEKMARLLLDWANSEGQQTDAGIRIRVLLTHEQIAQMLGTTRETVTRILSDLKKKQIIQVKGSTILITRPELLQALVTI